MAAGSLPTATSIKGSATPSFISTFLPAGWHSLSEGRTRDLIATPAPSGAPFGELDENRPLRCRTRWRFAICRDRFPRRQCVDRRLGPYRPPLRGAAGAEHDGDGDARGPLSRLAPGLATSAADCTFRHTGGRNQRWEEAPMQQRGRCFSRTMSAAVAIALAPSAAR